MRYADGSSFQWLEKALETIVGTYHPLLVTAIIFGLSLIYKLPEIIKAVEAFWKTVAEVKHRHQQSNERLRISLAERKKKLLEPTKPKRR